MARATKATNDNPITWTQLIALLNDGPTEKEVQTLLDKELAGPNRLLWKTRLYQRYSRMRREREHKHYKI